MTEKAHESRFNLKRIGYTLKNKVQAYTNRDGVPGHFVKIRGQDSLSPSSTLVWTDTTLSARGDLPGNAKFETQSGATVFTAETGASLTYYPDGSFLFSASASSPVSRRERLRSEQEGLPWFEKNREVIENQYIYEAGGVEAAPLYGESKKKGTPYKYFKLKIPVSETETRDIDVFAYGQAMGIVSRRNIRAGDLVRVRASVQFHEQRLAGGRITFVPWLNLFDVQKLNK